MAIQYRESAKGKPEKWRGVSFIRGAISIQETGIRRNNQSPTLYSGFNDCAEGFGVRVFTQPGPKAYLGEASSFTNQEGLYGCTPLVRASEFHPASRGAITQWRTRSGWRDRRTAQTGSASTRMPAPAENAGTSEADGVKPSDRGVDLDQRQKDRTVQGLEHPEEKELIQLPGRRRPVDRLRLPAIAAGHAIRISARRPGRETARCGSPGSF